MSDVSESLQIRTDAADRVIDRLREIGFNGFVFRGRHGWLTAIPYGGPGSLAISDEHLAQFSATLGAPVLNYQVNDFGWGFPIPTKCGSEAGSRSGLGRSRCGAIRRRDGS